MALSFRKKFVLSVLLLLVAVLLSGGSLLYLVLQDVPVEWQQDPNKVELLEANRKLKLLNDALSNKRKGFVRLSEVEINSYLQERYKLATNSGPNEASVDRAAVLLTGTNFTFLTWVTKPVFGYEVPLVWQRSIQPQSKTNAWSFAMTHMRIGALDIPARFWPNVKALLGSSDRVFEERITWLSTVPSVSLTRNEASRAPELRLYSHQPDPPRLQ